MTSGLTLKAIFWPSESVLHAAATPENVNAYFNNAEVLKLCLTGGELSSLVDFIAGSFARNKSNEVITLKRGLYGNSQFYQGVGNFHLMNTCNKWTAKGLESIGMDISPTFKLTANSIMSYIKNSEKVLAGCQNPPLSITRPPLNTLHAAAQGD